MPIDWRFLLNSLLLGVGLAMDAFSVSVTDGLCQPGMSRARMCGIAGVFGCFQALMPLLGWGCVHTIAEAFTALQPYIPWAAMGLLFFLGGKMLLQGLRGETEGAGGSLLMQGLATSIDALSVGFTIAAYSWQAALLSAAIIGAITFVLCLAGLLAGRFLGGRLASRAPVLGGIVLILIGLEILLTGL